MAEPEQADLLAKLHMDGRIPPADLVGKVDKGYAKLDYMGHAAVTDMLLATDPLWNWEPVAWTERGMPAVVLDKDGWPVGLWIRLTVHGHSRLGYGTCQSGKDDAMKELIGDALRNAAMRFGVALSLWAKEEWNDQGVEAGGTESRAGGRSRKSSPAAKGVSTTPAKAENDPQPGNVSQFPTPSDADVARHPAAAGREVVLPKDQALAKAAADLGLTDEQRRRVNLAVSGGRAASGKDLEDGAEVIWAATAYEDLANGVVQLYDDKDGQPRLRRVKVAAAGNNPGPTDEPF